MYCASGPKHPELLKLASDVGHAIADRGWTLVSGGGNVSAMGAVADGALARAGTTVRLISQDPGHRCVPDPDREPLVCTDPMPQRKD